MAKRRPMSKAETGIARVLWTLGSGTAREVHDELVHRRRPTDYSTVQTYLNRLEEKGYVTSTLKGRAKVFKPKVAPARVIKDAVDEFVTDLFDGNSLPLLQHLIQQKGVSEGDLAKLRELLDELESES